MEGFWYVLLILAAYLLPELLKRLRQRQSKQYQYPPPPLEPLEIAGKKEDEVEAAKIEKEPMFMPASLPSLGAAASKKLTAQTVLQGIIWTEILKPPLSKRRGGPHTR